MKAVEDFVDITQVVEVKVRSEVIVDNRTTNRKVVLDNVVLGKDPATANIYQNRVLVYIAKNRKANA